MAAAGRVIWWSLVAIYDETLLLLRSNIVWFLLSLPLALPLLLATMLLVPPSPGEEFGTGWPLWLMITGLLLLLFPSPAALGMHRIATIMQRRESPRWGQYWQGTRENLALGLKLYGIGVLGLVLLAVNTIFYLQVSEGPVQALAFLWLYLGLFWLGLQLYLGPLAIYLGERRLLALYRRAALLVLGNPIYTLTFLVVLALVMVLCLLVVPLYPGLAMAFVALSTTRGIAVLKQKYDPAPDPDEEGA